MKYLVSRICEDIIAGCQQAEIPCNFWTNVEIVADQPLHGVDKVTVTIPLFVPGKVDPAA